MNFLCVSFRPLRILTYPKVRRTALIRLSVALTAGRAGPRAIDLLGQPDCECVFSDALGSGKNALGPVIFAVFPGILGRGSLFAPGYQYVFDIGGDDDRSDISRSQIDLYFVWGLAKGKNWLILDPQIILDHENSIEFGTVEAEWGFMIAPKQGISAYLRPGAGIGADRPYDWNLEFAVKFVWR